jgi:F0F1-type ATP synthase membrane subunit c/vacuolar-type H+-ATPase subunit K
LDEPTLPRGEPYRPLGRRAQLVTILLIIGIGTTIAGVVSGLMERSLLDDVQQGRFITPRQADNNDRRQLIVALVDGTVFIATGIFFLLWFHRAADHQRHLAGERPAHHGRVRHEGRREQGAQPLPPLVARVPPHERALLGRNEDELERGDDR